VVEFGVVIAWGKKEERRKGRENKTRERLAL
jgi:hypothetical protein